jgi:hypothetical protein
MEESALNGWENLFQTIKFEKKGKSRRKQKKEKGKLVENEIAREVKRAGKW